MMGSESLELVKKAHKLYNLSLKFEERIPKAFVTFSMQICDKYTKIAKKEKMSLSEEELIKTILK